MTYSQLLDQSKRYEAILTLEKYVPYHWRRVVEICLIVVLIGLAIYLLGFNSSSLYGAGSFFIVLAVWLLFASLQFFFHSYYFHGSDADKIMTYDLAEMIFRSHVEDVTLSALRSPLGVRFTQRVGLFQDDIQEFQEIRQKPLSGFKAQFDGEVYTVFGYVHALFAQDEEFQSFLFKKGIQSADFSSAIEWVVRGRAFEKQRMRWWSKDRLARFEGFGVEWSYGKAYTLSRLSTPIVALHPTLSVVDFFEQYTITLESILTRNRNANALIIGEPGVGKEDVIAGLQKKIRAQKTDVTLRNQHIIKLDVYRLGASVGTKQELEGLLIEVLAQAEETGNTILVVPLSDLIRLGDEYNTDIISLLDPFLMSNDLHIIAYVDTDIYHARIEANSKIAQRFERILMKEGDEDVRIRILEDEAVRIESSRRVFFTYQAVEGAARSAARYFTGASDIEKATDILYEAAGLVKNNSGVVVTVQDVDAVVERLTGVPTSAAEGEEQELLINLEERMHERIIGQTEAVSAISNALRRSRSGLTDPKRPMGSFLFLGPTGVGKTETTKALAEIFFGDPNKVVRLDMSEFTGVDALDRLIGSRIGSTPGELVTRLRDNPYGVLHLDEFEKTNRDVINLFLRILDEGVFSSAAGDEVSARSMIIVATTNAGSDIIYEYLKGGDSALEYKDVVISTIIKRGTFSPELINRFDGTILFHPLQDEHLEKIAYLLLEKFNERLSEKGMAIEITQEVIDFLVEKGRNPQFGARPLRRAVQDHIENAVAQKIISGQVQTGTRIVLDAQDLARVDVSQKNEGQRMSDEKVHPLREEHSDHSFTFNDEDGL